MQPMHPHYAAIYRVVRWIPRGRVATFGQIALLAGLTGRARQVGYALQALPPGSPVPWQRVVNARGELSLEPDVGARQRIILAGEGLEFDERGRVDLKRFQWKPRHMRNLQAETRD
jgi:methylated-DNA-protein-cysteine methyltransferase-like protein